MDAQGVGALKACKKRRRLASRRTNFVERNAIVSQNHQRKNGWSKSSEDISRSFDFVEVQGGYDENV
jgi:hypothetical protein